MTAALAGWPTLGITSAAVPAWRALSQALTDRVPPCADDPELWHSRASSDIAAAREACRTCHAFTACDDYATAANEVVGVWAGVDRGLRPTPSRPKEATA
jgi:hypothetical protein